jgi:hypothetical protein
MNSNSYGFDFLKSEHVLPSTSNSTGNSHHNNQQDAAYNQDIYSNHPNAATTTNRDESDDVTSSTSRAVLMDDESFRHRESLALQKPALEKQFDILAFLQKHTRGSSASSHEEDDASDSNNNNSSSSSSSSNNRSSSRHQNSLPPHIIYRATGINLQEDTALMTLLQNNPKICIEYIPDPENPTLLIPHYAYQAKYPNIIDRSSLISQINRTNQGIPMIRDLYDCYTNIEQDIQYCICAGDVIAISNNDDRDKILFPRGDVFLTELDGIVTLPHSHSKQDDERIVGTNGGLKHFNTSTSSSTLAHDPLLNGVRPTQTINYNGAITAKDVYQVNTDSDPQKQIRRGEAIQIGGQWFRISSAVKANAPLSEQPVRAQAPLSVVSLTDLSSRNEVDGYIRTFTSKVIPLDHTLSKTAIHNMIAAKTSRELITKLAQSLGASSTGSGSSNSNNNNGSGSTRHANNSISGIIGQLTGSYAHALNPTTIAQSLSSNTAASAAAQQHSSTWNHRKRPNSAISTGATVTSFHHSQQQAQPPPRPSSIVSTKMALEKAAADPALALYNHARRHGCTKDIRDMYLATRKQIPESDQDLHRLLMEYKLMEPNEMMRRPRLMNLKNMSQNGNGSNLDNDGKPKKRRYYERKNQRMTNTHLEGTEIGALLALAAEKQKQGKSVGDGGM